MYAKRINHKDTKLIPMAKEDLPSYFMLLVPGITVEQENLSYCFMLRKRQIRSHIKTERGY